MNTRALLAGFGTLTVAALVASSCLTSNVSYLGKTRYPALPKGCPVEVFNSETPSYAWEDLATAQVRCHFSVGNREKCISELKELACKTGGDTLYYIKDGGASGEYTILTATVGRKKPESDEPFGESTTPSAENECNPACGKGFRCRNGTCVVQCTPACKPDHFCDKDHKCKSTNPDGGADGGADAESR